VILSNVGVKPTTFAVTLSTMKKHGLIEDDKDAIRLTAMGREQRGT
jgi:Mn-dependent DtxR family transcriptional regulator